MAMARSAPHTYVSALPFAPSSSRILNQYAHEFPRTLRLERGQLSDWPALEVTIQVHDTQFLHVAFSPDGQRIASASVDGTIHVWNATAGQVVAGPFTGHTDSVRSVAYSTNGQHTVSASDDGRFHVVMTATENIKNQFTDQFLICRDGWLYGEENELVLWIPELHRPCLHRPSTIWIAGKHETRLDLSDFAYGSNWATSILSQSF